MSLSNSYSQWPTICPWTCLFYSPINSPRSWLYWWNDPIVWTYVLSSFLFQSNKSILFSKSFLFTNIFKIFCSNSIIKSFNKSKSTLFLLRFDNFSFIFFVLFKEHFTKHHQNQVHLIGKSFFSLISLSPSYCLFFRNKIFFLLYSLRWNIT